MVNSEKKFVGLNDVCSQLNEKVNNTNVIKKLAGISLKEKWENMDCELFDICSFCDNSQSRKNDENQYACNLCYIPSILCSNLSHITLFEVISNRFSVFDKITMKDINNTYGYELFVKCLHDLKETGKISEEHLIYVKNLIKNFERGL